MEYKCKGKGVDISGIYVIQPNCSEYNSFGLLIQCKRGEMSYGTEKA